MHISGSAAAAVYSHRSVPEHGAEEHHDEDAEEEVVLGVKDVDPAHDDAVHAPADGAGEEPERAPDEHRDDGGEQAHGEGEPQPVERMREEACETFPHVFARSGSGRARGVAPALPQFSAPDGTRWQSFTCRRFSRSRRGRCAMSRS